MSSCCHAVLRVCVVLSGQCHLTSGKQSKLQLSERAIIQAPTAQSFHCELVCWFAHVCVLADSKLSAAPALALPRCIDLWWYTSTPSYLSACVPTLDSRAKPGLPPWQAAKRVLEEFERKAEEKRAAGKAKNDLEGYLIAVGEALGSDDELAQVGRRSRMPALLITWRCKSYFIVSQWVDCCWIRVSE